MQLSRPKIITFWIAVALAVIAFLGWQGIISGGVSGYSFEFLLAGFVLLALANILNDL